MKILHTADWHLGSSMGKHLSPQKARQRRAELLSRFSDMVSFAEEHDISAVLLGGDLSDTDALTAADAAYVLQRIQDADNIRFFYVSGNHDTRCFSRFTGAFPENLTVFGDTWQTVTLAENVTITGKTLSTDETSAEDFMSGFPQLDENGYHIVLMHGILSDGTVFGGDGDRISASALRGRNIDRLALGHIHAYREFSLDDRGTVCYCGCPEGRGFDECGEKGFVLMTSDDDGRWESRFVPFAGRRLHEASLDITEVGDSLRAFEDAVDAVIDGIPAEDMVKLILCGEDMPETDRDTDYIRQRLNERFYFAKIQDDRTYCLRAEQYKNDISLKGEFIRRVLASGLSEEMQTEIIRCGLEALK